MEVFQKRLILIPFFLIFIFSNAKISAQKDSIQNYKESYITVNILSHFNSFNPRWRFGYIKGINKNFKVGLDVGYGNKKVLFTDFNGSIGDNYRLLEIIPEFYYMTDYTTNSRLYVSLDMFYINHKDVFFNDSYLQKDGGEISYSRINYKREKYGFNMKFGAIIDLTNQLKLNIYAGLGLRVRKNIYTDIVNPSTTNNDDFFFFWSANSNYYYREGTRLGLNLPLGVKLLYKL